MSPVIDILLYMKLDVQRRRSIDAQAAMYKCNYFIYNKVVQADVGSLFFVSLDKNSTTAFKHFVIQLVQENSGLLHLSLTLCSDCDTDFSANHRSFQRAETSDMLYVLILSCGNLTS